MNYCLCHYCGRRHYEDKCIASRLVGTRQYDGEPSPSWFLYKWEFANGHYGYVTEPPSV